MSKSKLLQAFKMMQFDRNIAYITYLDLKHKIDKIKLLLGILV
jgi:hypothetical protein